MRAFLALALFACVASAHAATAALRALDTSGSPVAEAVIYLTNGSAPAQVEKPTTVDIDQVDREFVPRVTVVQAGTAIYFPNSDNIRHQVYSFSPAKTFTLKLYSGRPSTPVVFDQPGVVVLGCNIHDHMIAWVLSVATPWFAKADAQGRARIEGLAAGRYEAFVWMPELSAPVAAGTIELRADGRLDRDLTVPIAPAGSARSTG